MRLGAHIHLGLEPVDVEGGSSTCTLGYTVLTENNHIITIFFNPRRLVILTENFIWLDPL